MKQLNIHISLLLAFALSFSVSVVWAASPQEAAEAFLQTPGMPSADMAVIVTDFKDGTTLVACNADVALVPASIMKTATIAALSDVCDVEQSWDTPVYTDGKIKDGVLHGNLIVKGMGDPTLNSTVWPESADITTEIAEALSKKGGAAIEGRIIMDQTEWAGPSTPDSWMTDDLKHAYGTGSHAINYHNNASGKRSIANPSQLLERDLEAALAARGIEVAGNSISPGERKLLTVHRSQPLKEIMRSCMMRSDNLFAESMLRRFGKERDDDGSTAKAAKAEESFWLEKGLPMEGVTIVDGSGLSRRNRVTARFMDALLRHMAGNVEYASYFPLAGQEGTLRNFLAGTPLDSYIAMKTGSMRGIQCYAGYKLDDDFAPTHTVVIIVNNFTADRSSVRRAAENMLLNIFAESSADGQ